LAGRKGFPVWSAIILGLLFAGVIMAITAFLVERYVLGPLVNQDGLILFMSTIGVTFMIEGGAQMLFGSDVYPLALFPNDAWFLFDKTFDGGILVSKIDVWGGVIAAVLVAGWRCSPADENRPRAPRRRRRSRRGAVVAFRSTGSGSWSGWWPASSRSWPRPCGAPSSACSSRSRFLALKALPVLIIGDYLGAGAIVGGLIVGAGESSPRPISGPSLAAASNTGLLMCWR